MNYNAVILAGVVAMTGIWWVMHAARHYYPGPKVMTLYIHDDSSLVGTMGSGEAVSREKKGE